MIKSASNINNIQNMVLQYADTHRKIKISFILIRHQDCNCQENHLPICVKSQVIFLSRSSICSFTRLETTQTSINQPSWKLLHLISGQVEQWHGKRGRQWIWGFTSRVSTAEAVKQHVKIIIIFLFHSFQYLHTDRTKWCVFISHWKINHQQNLLVSSAPVCILYFQTDELNIKNWTYNI